MRPSIRAGLPKAPRQFAQYGHVLGDGLGEEFEGSLVPAPAQMFEEVD